MIDHYQRVVNSVHISVDRVRVREWLSYTVCIPTILGAHGHECTFVSLDP